MLAGIQQLKVVKRLYRDTSVLEQGQSGGPSTEGRSNSMIDIWQIAAIDFNHTSKASELAGRFGHFNVVDFDHTAI